MTKTILFLFLMLSDLPASQAASSIDYPLPTPTEAQCKIARSYFLNLSPIDLCTQNGGANCSTATSMPQALCLAGRGSYCDSIKTEEEGICLAFGGSLCKTAKNLAQGICLGLNARSICADLKSTDSDSWKNKLKKACI